MSAKFGADDSAPRAIFNLAASSPATKLSDEPNLELFKKTCAKIEQIPNIKAEPLLEDVDGTLLQIYHHDAGDVTVFNAYYFDNEVRIDSTFELEPYIGDGWFLRKICRNV